MNDDEEKKAFNRIPYKEVFVIAGMILAIGSAWGVNVNSIKNNKEEIKKVRTYVEHRMDRSEKRNEKRFDKTDSKIDRTNNKIDRMNSKLNTILNAIRRQ